MDDESSNIGGLGDFMEGIAGVWEVESNQLEHNSGHSATTWGRIDALRREQVERNGRVGVGDALGVGGHGLVIEEAIGAKEGDGEVVRVVVEDELAKLYHGVYVCQSRWWIYDDCLLHTFC